MWCFKILLCVNRCKKYLKAALLNAWEGETIGHLSPKASCYFLFYVMRSILPVFSLTLVYSFEILLRSESVLLLWMFICGSSAGELRRCQDLPHCWEIWVSLPSPFQWMLIEEIWPPRHFGPWFSPLQSLPVWRDSAFFPPPEMLLCCGFLLFWLHFTRVSLTTGWPNIEYRGRGGPDYTLLSMSCFVLGSAP